MSRPLSEGEARRHDTALPDTGETGKRQVVPMFFKRHYELRCLDGGGVILRDWGSVRCGAVRCGLNWHGLVILERCRE